jgi:hypothetical protein
LKRVILLIKLAQTTTEIYITNEKKKKKKKKKKSNQISICEKEGKRCLSKSVKHGVLNQVQN